MEQEDLEGRKRGWKQWTYNTHIRNSSKTNLNFTNTKSVHLYSQSISEIPNHVSPSPPLFPELKSIQLCKH